MTNNKKLYRSETNKIFAGIIGGLGEYLDVDPTLLRLAWVVLVVLTGIFPGVIAYFVALFIVPAPPHGAGSEAATPTDDSQE